MRSSLALIFAGIVWTASTSAVPVDVPLPGSLTTSSSQCYDSSPSTQDYKDFGLEPHGLTRKPKTPRLSHATQHSTSEKGWADPREHGGSMLDLVGNGLREPINAIISGHSDAEVLTEAGLRDYVRSIGFSFECLDLHRGGAQHANLGDGAGWQPELFEYRSTQGFGAPGRWVGACWESWNGGNHFRVWKQNGSEANTGAWFLAVSTEKNLRHHHTITPNGYNEGRDSLVSSAMTGGKFGQRMWKADVEWVQGLMPSGSDGINHDIDIDGMTAVLTIQRYWAIPPTKPGRIIRDLSQLLSLTSSRIAISSSHAFAKALDWLRGAASLHIL